MDKIKILQAIDAARRSKKLTKAAVAKGVGLHINSVNMALNPRGNPQLSTLAAILDAVGLEIELVPKGFGMPTRATDDGAHVPSVVDVALGRK